MRLNELQEKRQDLAQKIRNLGMIFTENGQEWKNEQEAEWTRVNAEYDEIKKQIEQIREVESRGDEFNRSVNTDGIPGTEDTRHRQSIEDRHENGPRVHTSGTQDVLFRTSDGRTIRGRSGTNPITASNEGPGIGEIIHASLTGGLTRSEFRGALGGVDSQGGYLLSPTASGRFIDLARSATVLGRAGAVTVPMDGSEMSLVQLTSDPTAHWRPEAVNVTASEPAFGRIVLRPRTLAAIVPVSIELLEDATNCRQVIESSLRAAMALEIDRVGLLGDGAESEPRGITNTSGVNTVTSVGTPADYGKYSQAVQKVQEANYPGELAGLSWVGHPRDFGLLDRLKDGEGRQVMPTPMTSPIRKLATTSIPTTLGGGSESLAIVGDFSQVIMGMRYSNVQIRVLDSGTVGTVNATASLQKFIIAHIRVDVAVIRPTWFTVMSGITAVEA